MNCKKVRLLGLILLGFGLTALQAQSKLYARSNNGNQIGVLLDSIRTITFTGANLQVNKSNNSSASFAINDQRYLSFIPYEAGSALVEMTRSTAFTVYPNPTNNELTVEFNLQALAKVKVDIYAIEGQLLLQQNAEGFVGANNIKISTSALAPGIYLLSLSEGNQRISKRLIITH